LEGLAAAADGSKQLFAGWQIIVTADTCYRVGFSGRASTRRQVRIVVPADSLTDGRPSAAGPAIDCCIPSTTQDGNYINGPRLWYAFHVI